MDPYHVLGVSRDASTDDIRKAYRALMKKYHPDINASGDAIRMTTMINEAYDLLTDPEKRSAYNNRIFAFDLSDLKEDPDEVYKRESTARNAEQAREKAKKKAERELKLYQVLRILCYPILIFSFVVIVDYYLPVQVDVDIPVYGYQNRFAADSYIKTAHYEFRVPDHLHGAYDFGAEKKKPLYIEFTPILETFTRVGVDEGEYAVMYDVPGSIYSFIFFPVPYIFLALSITFLRNREYSKQRYLFCLVHAAITVGFLVVMLRQ
jgi:hypothetical protein